MTSSYLRKPRRELDDALKDRGLGRDDLGFPEAMRQPNSAENIMEMGESGWLVLGVSALLIGGALIAALAMPGPNIADQPYPEEVYDISPAAGPAETVNNRYNKIIPYLPDPNMPKVPEAGLLQPLD